MIAPAGLWPLPRNNRAYIHRLRDRLLERFGGACARCGARRRLEFAHIRRTAAMGRGRGSMARALDVRRHGRRCYELLCGRCHRDYDAGLFVIRGRPSPSLLARRSEAAPPVGGCRW